MLCPVRGCAEVVVKSGMRCDIHRRRDDAGRFAPIRERLTCACPVSDDDGIECRQCHRPTRERVAEWAASWKAKQVAR